MINQEPFQSVHESLKLSLEYVEVTEFGLDFRF